MPEGDTLYRTAATLRKALLGRVVTRFESSVLAVKAVEDRHPLAGRTITAVEPRGKHLLITFAAPDPAELPPSATSEPHTPDPPHTEHRTPNTQHPTLVLHTHLRMTGSWHIYRPGEPWQKPERYAKVVIHTEAFVAPCFSAPVVELLTEWQAQRHQGMQELGPDAITPEFDPEEARRRILRQPEVPIAVALLNQRLMAGVGNIFKSEVLFVRRVSPFARVGELTEETIAGLVEESHRLLCANRSGGERRTVFGLSERDRLWVYGRSGDPCRVCGEPIRMRRQGIDARSTYYCPHCQNTGERGR
ncbi:MAG: Fpg/Nei family glycosylase [Armatimonadetes bacterium]|jgi:endonuclease-8|nr:Fpg/Nei family glycosylase [Armatimonadota bacterium]